MKHFYFIHTLWEETLGVSFDCEPINETPEMFGLSHDGIIIKNFTKKYIKQDPEELQKAITMAQRYIASGGKEDKETYKWGQHVIRRAVYNIQNADAPEDEKREALAAYKRYNERLEKLDKMGALDKYKG